MNWQAKWIWAESLAETRNCYVYARREFEAAAAPSAEAYVTCSSAYKLYVNGRYAGRGPSPCDSNAQYYDTHDLSHILRPGKNVIAAICHNGGARADRRPGGFLLQLEIHHNGDEITIIGTDETWRVKPADDWDFSSAEISSSMGFQEVYDSRRKPVGWNVVGFDDAKWRKPHIIGEAGCEPWTSLIPRQIPPLKEWEIHPTQVLKCGTVAAIDDPTLDIATRMYREPTTIDPNAVRYAKEMVSPSGEVAVISPGTDSFVVLDFGMEVVGFPALKIRGGGGGMIDIGYSEALDERGIVFPTRRGNLQADRLILHGGRQEWQTFGRRAFRYVQLTCRNLDTPVSIESVYLTRIGYPVEQVSTFECSDELLNEIWRTGVYTLSLCMQDCYEASAGFAFQRSDFARVQALINYYCFFDSALAAQALDQTADCAQHAGDRLEWVEMLHDYYLYTADLGLVTQLYPHLRRLMELGDDAPDQVLRCEALRSASKLAVAVSNSEDALRWHEQAASVQSAPGKSEERAADSCPKQLFYVLQDLAKQDKASEALDLIRRVWGEMLRRGATTWWASFPPKDDEISEDELCCGASGAPTYFLPAEILGVKPGLPGSGVAIQPRVGDLDWAKGHIKTIGGYADVEWRNEEGVFTIDIEAPAGFMVALPTSGLTNPMIDEIDLTPETPERRARKTYGWGHTIWRDGKEHDPYLDWLATQEAEPPTDYERRERCSAGESYIWVRESISTHVRYEVRDT